MAHHKLEGRKIKLHRLDQKAQFANQDDYQKQLDDAQTSILRVQEAYYHAGLRGIVVFEGWDAAGKGGAIRRLTEKLDPRGAKVWPIAAPKPEEQGRHYLYRFWTRLPERGTIAIFDRSWYGRVLVERVEGLIPKHDWKRAYREINEFERMLTDDGVRVVKLFMHITPDEQLRRFAERLRNPYKRWKLTTEDLRNRARRPDYEVAIHDMFKHTSTEGAPWHCVAANHKWRARVTALEIIAQALGDGISLKPPPVDPEVQKAAAKALGLAPGAIAEGARKPRRKRKA